MSMIDNNTLQENGMFCSLLNANSWNNNLLMEEMQDTYFDQNNL